MQLDGLMPAKKTLRLAFDRVEDGVVGPTLVLSESVGGS